MAELGVGLRFTEPHDFVSILKLAAFAEDLHTLEALENIPFRRNSAGAFETAVLRHGFEKRERLLYSSGRPLQP